MNKSILAGENFNELHAKSDWRTINIEVQTLSWPPTSQTVKLMFLYSTVSTLNPANKERELNCNFYETSAKK